MAVHFRCRCRSHTRPEHVTQLTHSNTYEDNLSHNHVGGGGAGHQTYPHLTTRHIHPAGVRAGGVSGGGVHSTSSEYNISSRQVRQPPVSGLVDEWIQNNKHLIASDSSN